MTPVDVDEIGRGVAAVIKRICRRPVDVVPHSTLTADLGFDSLQTLEFVAELEDRFDIIVPIERVPQIQTVGQAVDCVRSLLAESARP